MECEYISHVSVRITGAQESSHHRIVVESHRSLTVLADDFSPLISTPISHIPHILFSLGKKVGSPSDFPSPPQTS